MIDYEYVAPDSIQQCFSILESSTGKHLFLAGGTMLIPGIREKVIRPDVVIDLKHLSELTLLNHANSFIRIGALCTLTNIRHSQVIQTVAPILTEMAKHFGNPLVRNSATIGGNLAVASPFSDAVVPLLALDSMIILQSSNGTHREVPISEFIVQPYQTVIRPNELVTGINVKAPKDNVRWFYRKLGRRRAGSTAIVSVAGLIQVNSGKVTSARIALGAVSAIPVRAKAAELALENEMLNDATIRKCVTSLEREMTPVTDNFASSEYRGAMARVTVERALRNIS